MTKEEDERLRAAHALVGAVVVHLMAVECDRVMVTTEDGDVDELMVVAGYKNGSHAGGANIPYSALIGASKDDLELLAFKTIQYFNKHPPGEGEEEEVMQTTADDRVLIDVVSMPFIEGGRSDADDS